MHRLFAAAAAALVIGLLYAYDPATTAWFPSCPFRALTGLLCPLCGSLRAAHELLHGHIVDAFLLNPFTFAIGVVTLVISPFRQVRLKADTTPAGVVSGFSRTVTFVVAAIVYTVLRNLP
jgi:hypothetical protein